MVSSWHGLYFAGDVKTITRIMRIIDFLMRDIDDLCDVFMCCFLLILLYLTTFLVVL